MSKPVPLAFAISKDGSHASYLSSNSLQDTSFEDAVRDTIRSCEYQVLDSSCFIHIVGENIQNPDVSFMDTVPNKIIQGEDTSTYSVAKALGVIFYFPGFLGWKNNNPKSFELNNNQTIPKYLKYLGNKGWNVMRVNVPRFSRLLSDKNKSEYALTINRIIKNQKALGYKRIVLAGDSKGSHEILSTLSVYPELPVDSIILIEPADFGASINRDGSIIKNYEEKRTQYLKDIFQNINVKRIIFVSFENSDWYSNFSNKDIDYLFQKMNGTIMNIINPVGHFDHGAGWSRRFEYEYGNCINNFLLNVVNKLDDCVIPEIDLNNPNYWASAKNIPKNLKSITKNTLVQMSFNGQICSVNFETGELTEPPLDCVSFSDSRRRSTRFTAPYYKTSIINDSPVEYTDTGYCEIDKLSSQITDRSCITIYEYKNLLLFVEENNKNVWWANDKNVWWAKYVPDMREVVTDYVCKTDSRLYWDQNKIECIPTSRLQ